jgi:hypothetical protein
MASRSAAFSWPDGSRQDDDRREAVPGALAVAGAAAVVAGDGGDWGCEVPPQPPIASMKTAKNAKRTYVRPGTVTSGVYGLLMARTEPPSGSIGSVEDPFVGVGPTLHVGSSPPESTVADAEGSPAMEGMQRPAQEPPMAKRVPEGQAPILAVVRGEAPKNVPLELAEAEAMVDLAAWLRARARRLPEDSPLGDEWLAAAEHYSLSARVLWPGVGQPALAVQPETA